MNPKEKDMVQQNAVEDGHPHDHDHAHVHGPHCNHGHHHAPVRRDSPKVGRNDPCICGSGKKYKKCCG